MCYCKRSNDELFIAWRLHTCTTIVQQWQLVKLRSNECCDENNVNLNAHMNGLDFLIIFLGWILVTINNIM